MLYRNAFSKGKGLVTFLDPGCFVSASLRRNFYYGEHLTKHTLNGYRRFNYKRIFKPTPLCTSLRSPLDQHILQYSSHAGKEDHPPSQEEEKKLTLLQKFKQMYRDYWYVLVPVHVATSIVWYGSFFYIAKSGVDVAALLKSMGFGESIVSPLRDSSAGHLAVAYAMYKIATPARYTVTLGGTTISIKYLKQWGYIRPIPPKEKLKEMYAEKKESMVESYRERRESMVESYREKKESVRSGLQEAKDNIKHGLRQGLSVKSKDLPKENPKKEE